MDCDNVQEENDYIAKVQIKDGDGYVVANMPVSFKAFYVPRTAQVGPSAIATDPASYARIPAIPLGALPADTITMLVKKWVMGVFEVAGIKLSVLDIQVAEDD